MVRTWPILRNLGMIIASRIYQKAVAAVARGESLTKASKDNSIPSRILRLHRDGNVLKPGAWKNHTEQQLRDHNYANISNGALDAWTVCERRRPTASCIRNRRDLCSEASIQPQYRITKL